MHGLCVKATSVTSFLIGHTKKVNNELFENIKVGMTIVAAALKKGEENKKRIFDGGSGGIKKDLLN